jgi:hypothetical protein
MEWILALAIGVTAAVTMAFRAGRLMRRQRELMSLCRRAGLQFQPVDPFDDLWQPFRLLGQGEHRRTENAVWARGEQNVRAFDLVVHESGDRPGFRRITRRLSCAIAELPFSCPGLEVVPRESLDAELGGQEIDLELEDFNRRFRVFASDPRAAVAFLDQRMMQALLHLPEGISMAVNEDRILLWAQLLRPPEVLLLLEVAGELRDRVPNVMASLYPPRPMIAPKEARWLQGHWSEDPTSELEDVEAEQGAG